MHAIYDFFCFSFLILTNMANITRDFGSFHSSNVEELINLSEDRYVSPKVPFALPSFPDPTTEEFGLVFRRVHFHLDPNWTFLNHGAFGCATKEVLKCAQDWQVYCETQPLRFLDRELFHHLVDIARRLAKYVGSEACDLLLLPNVTTGMNIVLRSLACQLKKEDLICFFNTTYGSTKKILSFLKTEYLLQSYQIDLTFPFHSKKNLLDTIKKGLRQETKVIIIDHISSNYGIVFPVEELVQVCHDLGIIVVVDGAHALGTLPISLRSIGADFYIANGHKWFGAAKGCGFMFVKPEHQRTIKPLVVSHGYGSGFVSDFIWTGLRDYSSWLALRTVLDFWEHYTADRIQGYILDTVQKGAALLLAKWGTGLLDDAKMFGPMILVELPKLKMFVGEENFKYESAEKLQNLLYFDHNIEVPVKAIQGRLYVRISAYIYNELHEFEKLATTINTIKL